MEQFANYLEMYPTYILPNGEARHLPSKHNQKTHASGKTGIASGVGASAKVTIEGKQYGIGDNISINGKPHHIADITPTQAIVRPGAAPKSTTRTQPKPASVKRAKTVTNSTKTKTTVTKNKDGDDEFPTKTGKTKAVKQTDGKWMSQKELATKMSTKVTPAEQKSMDFYDSPRGAARGSGAMDMNPYLRKGKMESHFDKKTPEHVANLKSAISKHKAPEDMMVSRTISIQGLGFSTDNRPDLQYGNAPKAEIGRRIRAAKDDHMNNIVGTVARDKGFMSTTLARQYAGDSSISANSIANVAIRVPKGTNMVHLNNAEQEVVFGPQTKLAFTGASKREDGKWNLEAQIVS